MSSADVEKLFRRKQELTKENEELKEQISKLKQENQELKNENENLKITLMGLYLLSNTNHNILIKKCCGYFFLRKSAFSPRLARVFSSRFLDFYPELF